MVDWVKILLGAAVLAVLGGWILHLMGEWIIEEWYVVPHSVEWGGREGPD